MSETCVSMSIGKSEGERKKDDGRGSTRLVVFVWGVGGLASCADDDVAATKR